MINLLPTGCKAFAHVELDFFHMSVHNSGKKRIFVNCSRRFSSNWGV